MEWARWEPFYRAILADFGYDPKADEAARDRLAALCAHKLRVDLDALRAAVLGREVAIVGPRPSPIPDLPLFASDASAGWLVPRARPLCIVTDLDGDVPVQLAANAMGVPLFVHAHGDNLAALDAHVPAMRGPVAGTTQAAPAPGVENFGGFTDGDRAACLAAHLGASGLVLVGFDLDTPWPKPGRDAAMKARKLAWARRIIDSLGLPVRAL